MRSFTSTKVARQVRLEQYACVNRRTPTRSEARLWEELRGRKLGVQFRRQVPFAGRFIADFFAPAIRLIVEVDGGYHRKRRARDERRDRTLRRLGYRVLRLEADLISHSLSGVLDVLRLSIRESMTSSGLPGS